MRSATAAFLAGLMAVTALVVASPDVGPPAAARELTYGLTHTGEDRAACDESQLLLRESQGSGPRCGRLKANVPCRPLCLEEGRAREAPLGYALREKFNHTVHPGFKGQARVSLWFEAPDEVQLTVSIVVGGTLRCTSSESTPRPALANEWLDFELPECTFGQARSSERRAATEHERPEQPTRATTPPSASNKPEPATGSLRVELAVRSQLNHYVGHEADHAGWVTFAAAPPEDPSSRRSERPQEPARSTPTIAACLAVLLVGTVAVGRGRP